VMAGLVYLGAGLGRAARRLTVGIRAAAH